MHVQRFVWRRWDTSAARRSTSLPRMHLAAPAGATYTGWDKLNTASIKLFVDTFGLGEAAELQAGGFMHCGIPAHPHVISAARKQDAAWSAPVLKTMHFSSLSASSHSSVCRWCGH